MLGHFVYAALNGHKLMSEKSKESIRPEDEGLSEEAKDLIE